MERKIGEIFELGGEWYQCVVAIQGCRECSFRTQDYCTRHFQCLSELRRDKTSVVFKKLEKVGEPILYGLRLTQRYKVSTPVEMPKDPSSPCMSYNFIDNLLYIEIKQNKEDMEENKLNLKPFDIQKAREGKPVCTRNGRKARIICFDFQSIENTPIVAAVQVTDKQEVIANYYEDGRQFVDGISELDLMMLPEKKEGWVNLYKSSVRSTKEEAMKYRNKCNDYIDTIKIEWEE